MKIKINFIHASGKSEETYVYVEAVSDFAFIDSLVSEFKLKRKNVPSKKEISVYIDEDSDFEFIVSVVSAMKYEINNDRAQNDWRGGNQDDYEYQDYPAQDNTSEEALRNIERADVSAAVRAAVKKLKPTEQFIINRLYLDPVTVTPQDLAMKLGVEPNTLYKRVFDIKKTLRLMLTKKLSD